MHYNLHKQGSCVVRARPGRTCRRMAARAYCACMHRASVCMRLVHVCNVFALVDQGVRESAQDSLKRRAAQNCMRME